MLQEPARFYNYVSEGTASLTKSTKWKTDTNQRHNQLRHTCRCAHFPDGFVKRKSSTENIRTVKPPSHDATPLLLMDPREVLVCLWL